MWVRIDEIAFLSERSDDVINHIRDTAVSKHDGEGFRGFRLLVDRANGRALDVSYWDTYVGAVSGEAAPGEGPVSPVVTQVVGSNVYELCIDAV